MRHALTLAAILAASPAMAGPYLYLKAGVAPGPCPSNDCGIETGSEAGPVAGIGGGYEWGIGDRLSLGIEGDLAGRWWNIHGYNVDGHKDSADHRDGNTLVATSLMVNLLPCVLVVEPVSVCATVGAGGAHLSALDDSAVTPAWQVGGGLAVDLREFTGKPLTFSLGVRRFEARPVDLAGAEAEFTTREVNARLTYSFDGWGG